jgi:beta-lactamase class A
MLTDLRTLALGDSLAPGSRARLVAWLVTNKTGDQQLRAGLPRTWKVGDKTGSGKRGTSNDLAIAWPGRRAPLLVSVYLTGATGDYDARNAIIAAVGRQVGTVVG